MEPYWKLRQMNGSRRKTDFASADSKPLCWEFHRNSSTLEFVFHRYCPLWAWAAIFQEWYRTKNWATFHTQLLHFFLTLRFYNAVMGFNVIQQQLCPFNVAATLPGAPGVVQALKHIWPPPNSQPTRLTKIFKLNNVSQRHVIWVKFWRRQGL